jgi:MFS family permease
MPKHAITNIVSRDYALSFIAFFGFLAAYHALTPTLPLYLARLGSNEREIGVLVGTIGVSSLVTRLLVGRVLLKHSEKVVMMWGAVMFSLSFLALIVLRPFWPLLVVRLLQGIAFASLDTAAIAYVIRIVPETYRSRAINYFLLAPSLASAIAATSGVYVVNEYGFPLLLLVCTGLPLGSFLLSLKLKGPEMGKQPVRSTKNRLFFQRKILAPAIMSFLFYVSLSGVRAFFPLYSLQCGVKNPGYFFSASAIMVVAVRMFGGRVFETYGKEKVIATFILVSAASVTTLALSSTLVMFVLVGLVWGMAIAFLIPVSMAYALEFAGSSDGSAVGSYQTAMDSGIALGPVITGFIVPHTGYRVAFLFLAFTCLANFGYFRFYLRKKARAVRTG